MSGMAATSKDGEMTAGDETARAPEGCTPKGRMSEGGVVDIKGIMGAIPHRYPFLLIDRMEDVVLGESATGIKNVSVNEPFFAGHFPNHPVMPGVLIIE